MGATDVDARTALPRDEAAPLSPRRCLHNGANEKRYIAGALDASTRQLTWVAGTRKRSDLFCQLLWRLVAEHRSARRIHVILDNYIIHSSKITRHCVEQFGGKVVLHFLPPYRPDHNRIERVWLDLHANVSGIIAARR